MSPRVVEFWVSASAARHMLERHDVTVEEALEAAHSTLVFLPGHPARAAGPDGVMERRYILPGRTDEGRRLWVIVGYEGGGVARIITAYEATGSRNRALHRRARGD